MTSPLEEVVTPRGTFTVPTVAEPHTIHNPGSAGVALIYNVRTLKEKHVQLKAGATGEHGHHITSDWVMLGWVSR